MHVFRNVLLLAWCIVGMEEMGWDLTNGSQSFHFLLTLLFVVPSSSVVVLVPSSPHAKVPMIVLSMRTCLNQDREERERVD